MHDDATAHLIRRLHYQGRVSDEQLREIIARHKGSGSEALLKSLLAEGIVDAEWVAQARTSMRQRARRQKDTEETTSLERSFGQVALERKWITLEQLEEAILEQQRLRRMKLQFRIGEILLRFRRLNLAQVREILAEQGRAVGGCERCATFVRVMAGAEDTDPTCPICNGQLVESIFLDAVHVDRARR